MMHHPRVFWQALFVSALILYLLTGVQAVPFHGDESTIIAMSRDWYRLAAGDVQGLLYRDPPPDADYAADQDLRLLNGVLSKYAIGLLAWLAGIPESQINRQWLWGASLDFNRDTGHVPDAVLLFVARWSSALVAALSVALVFAIGKRLRRRGRWNQLGAWLAVAVYVTLPAVLLNGRRAMFEGATLATSALLILTAIWLAQRLVVPTQRHVGHLHQTRSPARRLWPGFLIYGLTAGLALSAKHTNVMFVAPLSVALLWAGRHRLKETLAGLTGAGMAAAALFLALNPAWWNAPLRVPGVVLQHRAALMRIQAETFGMFDSTQERLTALLTQPVGPAQYYEVPEGWSEWLREPIAAYGPFTPAFPVWDAGSGGLALVLLALGAVVLWRDPWPRQRMAALIVLVTGVVVALGLYLTNLLPWQRYYLPLAICYSVLFGAALAGLVRGTVTWLHQRRSAPRHAA